MYNKQFMTYAYAKTSTYKIYTVVWIAFRII